MRSENLSYELKFNDKTSVQIPKWAKSHDADLKNFWPHSQFLN